MHWRFVMSFALGAALMAPACTRPESRLIGRTVLDVNGQKITTKDFAEKLAKHLRNRDPLIAKDPQLLERAKNDLADAMILQIISEQWAGKNGISVSDADVEKRVQEVRSEYADDLAFRKMLAEENISIDSWKETLRSDLLRRKVFDAVTASAPNPTDAELRAAYESGKKNFAQPARIRLRQIVLEKEEDAKRVYDEVVKGRDIGELAKQFSIAPEAASNGDTGWVDKGLLEVFDQGFKMPVGAKSKIVKSPYGYHIFSVLAKEPERKLSIEQAKSGLVRELKEQKSRQVFALWLEAQLRASSVKRDEAILKSIVLSTRTE